MKTIYKIKILLGLLAIAAFFNINFFNTNSNVSDVTLTALACDPDGDDEFSNDNFIDNTFECVYNCWDAVFGGPIFTGPDYSQQEYFQTGWRDITVKNKVGFQYEGAYYESGTESTISVPYCPVRGETC